MKTPLTHIQGEELRRGDPQEAARLAEWLRVADDERDEATTGVHAVHPYPGRMHPLWARRIIGSLPADASILDPFCGSGTVLVEARLADRHARGSDVNPLAVRLARLRCIPHAEASLVRREAERCARGCGRRRETPFSALAQGESAYPRHVLAGLISLRDEIEQTEDARVREVLLFGLSPLLDKLAARRDQPAPRVPRTAVRDFFMARVERWLLAFDTLDSHRFAEVEVADARWLPWKAGSAGAVVTSPPYPGVYDYAGEQARRLRWLDADPAQTEAARRKEIGRRSKRPDWLEGMEQALWQMCRATRPGSPMYLVVGDGVMGGKVLRADRIIERLAASLPLEWVAAATQSRPHFHGPTAAAFRKQPRCEHLVLLRRTDAELGERPKLGKAKALTE